ncbi:MAG: enoyl-CoA hydratase/isomerase family protein [Caulobacterales bacterium]|nr:enoyl-CoA hydratase/isomerase family protein [Caulobacterales bacterium]
MTNKHFHLDLDSDGVLIATFDSPDVSMNVLGEEIFAEVKALAERASSDDAVKGVVLTSGKDSFCAGMNLDELSRLLKEVSGPVDDALKQRVFEGVYGANTIFRQLETCGKPVAAALNGLALGGGFELALSCHYRVLADHSAAQVGLPEAMVGLFPGAGGTQRLPRMIGVMASAPLMLQGKTLRPQDALQQGLVNELAPAGEVVAKAKA